MQAENLPFRGALKQFVIKGKRDNKIAPWTEIRGLILGKLRTRRLRQRPNVDIEFNNIITVTSKFLGICHTDVFTTTNQRKKHTYVQKQLRPFANSKTHAFSPQYFLHASVINNHTIK